MKSISSLIVPMLALSSVVFGQPLKNGGGITKSVQKAMQAANKAVNPTGWQTARIGKWGIESLILPDGLRKKPETVERRKSNGKITSTYYSQRWEIIPKGEILPSLEVKMWTADDFVSPPRITPELRLSFIHQDNENDKKRRNNPADEVKYLKLESLQGGFARFQAGNRIKVYWTA